MKYKVGMKVRFNDDCSHNEFPEYYPKVGTIGKIIKCFDDNCLVQWPNGSTNKKNSWYCENDFLDIVEENDNMSDKEIWNILKNKMEKNNINGFYFEFPGTFMYDENEMMKAVSLAYTVGYKRAKKGRPFKYGDKQ